eukprot:SAG22_NODE_6423_length_857_cov_1.829815_1_plen_53_part_10
MTLTFWWRALWAGSRANTAEILPKPDADESPRSLESKLTISLFDAPLIVGAGH